MKRSFHIDIKPREGAESVPEIAWSMIVAPDDKVDLPQRTDFQPSDRLRDQIGLRIVTIVDVIDFFSCGMFEIVANTLPTLEYGARSSLKAWMYSIITAESNKPQIHHREN